ncbi:Glycosyltransferase family 92 protein [Aphelenchoides bicaudatus]|nr:Glycosyltransferase family 92 protein [Aphelenchoides bicaudatus]
MFKLTYNSATVEKIVEALRSFRFRFSAAQTVKVAFRIVIIICAFIFGASLYYRTTNLWTLKNLGDRFISKSIGRRPIVIGAFHRPKSEQNVAGSFAVIQFLGNTKEVYELYCHSVDAQGRRLTTTAQIESITKAKRAANDVCSWGGFLAECQISSPFTNLIQLTTNSNPENPDELIDINIEPPVYLKQKHKLVVCVAPMYIYTEWQIMLTGIETWLALGATKLIFPIQSASTNVLEILKQYEAKGIVIIRSWPKWPVFSDTNPNGLILSRGIEESHVNCLHFAKPFAELIAFTDIDDMLIPPDPLKIYPTANIDLLESLFREHPQAGSFLFEHRDVQFVLPEVDPENNSLQNFNFQFLHKTQWKQSCKVWRMKTRVVVNASRVDTVNMHETGDTRQVRVPCRQAHFYHLRHSYKNVGMNEWRVDMNLLASNLDRRWKKQLENVFPTIANQTLTRSNTESFEDFDRCVMLITEGMTPHVCFSRVVRNISCVANLGEYEFAHSSNGDFIIVLRQSKLVNSETNCEAPMPTYIKGNHFYLP